MSILGKKIFSTHCRFYFFKPFIDLETCLAQPEKFDGTCIEIYGDSKAGQIISNPEFELIKADNHIRAIGPIPENLDTGDVTALRAIFHN